MKKALFSRVAGYRRGVTGVVVGTEMSVGGSGCVDVGSGLVGDYRVEVVTELELRKSAV